MADHSQNRTPPGGRAGSSSPRGERLWHATKDGRTLTCELRDNLETGTGWEVVLRLDDEIILTHRSESKAIAHYFADVLREDHLRTGWTASE